MALLTAVLTLKLPGPVAARLRLLARRTGKPQSQILREGLEWRLRLEGRAASESALERAGDLVGSLEGPRDLATNPKYLRGFGT